MYDILHFLAAKVYKSERNNAARKPGENASR